MKIANSWYKLSEAQVLAVAPYVLQEMSISNKLKVFEVLLNPIDVPSYAKLKPDKVLRQLKKVEFLWRENLVEPIIPKFTLFDVEYCLPAHHFTNIKLVEFAFACDYFDAMMGQGNYKGQKAQPEMLNRLIATLCRPSKGDDSDGDIRVKFNENLLDSRASLFERLSPMVKAYFLLYFLGCKKALSEQFKVLFKKQEGQSDSTKKYYVRPIDYAWFKIIFDLADEGTFGKYEEVCHQNIYTVMHYLTSKYYDFQELKSESKA